ncbi:heavy-metal-associated domain-containing protein [Tepidibacter mesophilus]|uniref:heavy-metal-associated domain-containing protein n=1 Tax=Tepidibacter mesophilus TaxID=655607 RepID=UPI000C06E725|nr:heavy metal-associated domain-containing protein [Tepidibacter mesophilus]
MWVRSFFYIEGMTCLNCETKIEKALLEIDGVKNIKANFLGSHVTFIHNNKINKIGNIIQTIESRGYTVKGSEEKVKRKTNISYVFTIIISIYFLYYMVSYFL